MRFGLNFLKEFLQLECTASELARALTIAGMEVEGLEKVPGDWIFDIEVTTNRYDWLSIVGIAREASAVTGSKLTIKLPEERKKIFLKQKKIIIQDKSDCPYYTGRLIEGVSIGEPSQEIKDKILNCRINSINDAVDITNYCMLKWGNPLHVFDNDKVKGNIYIRRAIRGEKFLGLDDKERILDEKNLVIADEEKVIALAGIMGAKNTEVDQNTKSIFLEAAVFSPLAVRASRRSAGLDTESSYRFERRVSPRNLEFASLEAADLIVKKAGGVYKGMASAGSAPYNRSISIPLNINELNDYLGSQIPAARIKKIITSLGCQVKEGKAGNLIVKTPLERFDLEIKEDIYEEVARIYGFDNIKAKIPCLAGYFEADLLKDKRRSLYCLKDQMRRFFSLYNFKEIITYSMQSKEELEKLKEKDIISIVNPLRSQENALRASLLSGMLQCQRYNLNRNKETFPFFELADIYRRKARGYIEETVLSLGLAGDIADFLFLKRAVEASLKEFGINDYKIQQQEAEALNPGLVISAQDFSLGFLGRVNKDICNSFDIKQDFFFAQLNLEAYIKLRADKNYAAFSPYPEISRDISIIIGRQIKFKDIEKIIRQKGSYLTDLQVVDFYKGKDIAQGCQAFTLRLFYQSQDKTLNSEEVDSCHNGIRLALSQLQGVSLR
ncbi:MAG: phenylalanine--tRNA ligase subunit beta [Candidatus Omnitrophica bacterium]|nr:phenylalanine--tRNA ligase subunit beta [Candidatus Omnitrophota bacterium]